MTSRKTWFRMGEFLAALALLVALAALGVSALMRSREAAGNASCMSNLKQLGIVMKMYANESKGERYPPLSPIPNNWIFDMNAVYPEYMTDLRILVCPSSRAGVDFRYPDCVSSLYYVYTGYTIIGDEQALALFEAYHRLPYAVFAEDLTLPVPVWTHSGLASGGGPSAIPVLWDRVPLDPAEFSHTPHGCNVLHMDGHVEFVPYSYYNNSDYFPVTRLSAETFGSVLPFMPFHCYD